MTDTGKDALGFDALIDMWTRSMTDTMSTMTQMWSASQKSFQPGKDVPGFQPEALSGLFKSFQTMASAMAAPESMHSVFKGSGNLPEMMSQLAMSTMSSLAELQTKASDSVRRMGESVDAYQFNNLDDSLIRVWQDIYKKEFQKFFHAPQLGLTREYQERINTMTDKFQTFQTDLAEFLRLLTLPFHRAMGVMQEKIVEMAETGDLPEDSQAYYRLWIKVLEGHFMTLFQTPEYVQALTRTINSMSEFSKAKNDVLEDMIQGLPVASQTEMDDMAKEIYILKRRIRKIEQALRQRDIIAE